MQIKREEAQTLKVKTLLCVRYEMHILKQIDFTIKTGFLVKNQPMDSINNNTRLIMPKYVVLFVKVMII